MTDAAAPAVVRIHRFVSASPDRVFAAWTDPVTVARWLSPSGRAEAELEPRVGGRLRVTMIGEGMQIEHTGEYRELVPGRRLVFTWQSPYTGLEPSIVTVDLRPVPGGTALTLVHERLPAGGAESHTGGWAAILDRLEVELGRDPVGGSR